MEKDGFTKSPVATGRVYYLVELFDCGEACSLETARAWTAAGRTRGKNLMKNEWTNSALFSSFSPVLEYRHTVF